MLTRDSVVWWMVGTPGDERTPPTQDYQARAAAAPQRRKDPETGGSRGGWGHAALASVAGLRARVCVALEYC